MTNIASHTTAYDDNDRSSGINIAKSDKKMMNLEKELKLKKKQLKEDYHMMLKNVKQNPYLKVAIHEYETFFESEKEKTLQKVDALSKLLKLTKDEMDKFDILREIKRLNKMK